MGSSPLIVRCPICGWNIITFEKYNEYPYDETVVSRCMNLKCKAFGTCSETRITREKDESRIDYLLRVGSARKQNEIKLCEKITGKYMKRMYYYEIITNSGRYVTSSIHGPVSFANDVIKESEGIMCRAGKDALVVKTSDIIHVRLVNEAWFDC